MQTVVPYDAYGGHHTFANNASAHKTEDDGLATSSNGLQLYAEWRRYWNVSRPILAEKSPRQMLIMRLLQHWFTPERSHFIGIIRHPFGTVSLTTKTCLKNITRVSSECAFREVEHWITANRLMLDDMRRLRHKALVRFETFAGGDQEGLCLVCAPISANACIAAQFMAAFDRLGLHGRYVASGQDSHDRRRKFHGDRAEARVESSMIYGWEGSYREMFASHAAACNATVQRWEAEVREFGYSLVDLRWVADTELIKPFLIG